MAQVVKGLLKSLDMIAPDLLLGQVTTSGLKMTPLKTRTHRQILSPCDLTRFVGSLRPTSVSSSSHASMASTSGEILWAKSVTGRLSQPRTSPTTGQEGRIFPRGNLICMASMPPRTCR